MMKKILLALAFAAPFTLSALVSTAHAADNPQQNKMAVCNKEADGKKGDERKTFMKSCLSKAKANQQEKMKTCNKDATGKKGDERKAFMKSCLSK